MPAQAIDRATLRASALKNNQQRRYYIASGGGRMVTTMDRYEADWSIVERGYNAHVLGEGPLFPDSTTASNPTAEPMPMSVTALASTSRVVASTAPGDTRSRIRFRVSSATHALMSRRAGSAAPRKSAWRTSAWNSRSTASRNGSSSGCPACVHSALASASPDRPPGPRVRRPGEEILFTYVVADEFFGTEQARDAVRQKVTALFPAHEVDAAVPGKRALPLPRMRSQISLGVAVGHRPPKGERIRTELSKWVTLPNSPLPWPRINICTE